MDEGGGIMIGSTSIVPFIEIKIGNISPEEVPPRGQIRGSNSVLVGRNKRM